jgi:guanine deaminase
MVVLMIGLNISNGSTKDQQASPKGSFGAYRAQILYFMDDPTKTSRPEDAYRYIEDGMLIVANGKIAAVGDYRDLKDKVKDLTGSSTVYAEYKDDLIMPGFIDSHIHYPQTELIASYGEQLLEWLTMYTFPTERQFASYEHASKISKAFLKELLRNGTTTALVLGTVHKESVDALFEAALKVNMRLIAGKVMMDRNAPDYLLDTAASSYEESRQLIEKWHGRGRLLYAVTPRFAPTSTLEQLKVAAKLKHEYPTTYIHTHLSENLAECEWVKSLYPDSKNYLDVYHGFGLTGNRSIFAHGVHLSDEEFQMLHDTGSAVIFCPTSNLFLGSGLFKMRDAKKKGREVKVGMGTDVGGGSTFNMLQTLNEAYKVVLLQQNGMITKVPLSVFEGLYQGTLGSARSLGLDDKVGTFKAGTEADFIVLSFAETDLQALRMNRVNTRVAGGEISSGQGFAEKLFVLMTLGDDRNIKATYLEGRPVHQRQNKGYTNKHDMSAVE